MRIARFLGSRTWTLLCALGVLAILFAASLLLAWLHEPPSRTPVRLVNHPERVVFACVVVDGDTETKVLPWCHRRGFPFATTRHPGTDVGWWSGERLRHVRWQNGGRYGAVIRTTDGKWNLIWCKSVVDTNSTMGRYLLGKVEVDFYLAGGERRPLDRDELERLGLDKVDEKLHTFD